MNRGLAIIISTITASPIVSAQLSQPGSPVYGVTLPDGYRDWKVVTVAHEAGMNNDIRAVLGNEVALKAFREGTRPFPEGTVIARLAWEYRSSAANDAVFPAPQSFVAGPPTNVQISVKDSQRYAATGGWGYGQFKGGQSNPSVPLMQTCFACHVKISGIFRSGVLALFAIGRRAATNQGCVRPCIRIASALGP